MVPLQLTLRGFAGVVTAKNEVRLNLESIPADAQLVALAGPNGAGKTTLMDNLHPYRVMPSRATSVSPRGFSYWDHLTGTESFKELIWLHAGRRFISTFAFKQTNKTRKADYYLHEATSSGLVPVRMQDGTVADGKADTYDRCVEHVLGAPEMFFSSVFSAQNKVMLSSMTHGEISKLMVSLLGLDQCAAMSVKTGQVLTGLRALQGTLQEDARIAVLNRESHQAAGVALERLLIEQTALRKSFAEASAQSVRAAGQLAVFESERIRGRETIKTRSALETRKIETVRLAKERIAVEIIMASRKGVQFKIDTRQITEDEIAAFKQISEARKALRSLEDIVSQRQAIMAAVTGLGAAQSAAEIADAALRAARKSLDDAQKTRVDVSRREGDLERLQDKGESLASESTRLEHAAQLANEVPCVGMDVHAKCPMLRQAIESGGKQKQVFVQLQSLRKEFGVKRALAKTDAEAVEKRLGETKAILADAEIMQTRAQASRAGLDKLAALAQALEAAEANRAAHLKTVSDQESRVKDLHMRHNRLVQAEAEIAMAHHAALASIGKEEAARLAEIDGMLGALPAVAGEAEMQQAKATLSALNARRDAIVESINDNVKQCAELQARIGAFNRTSDETVLRRKLDLVDGEVALYALLQKAFGKDGIIALSIDDAGPSLAAVTNDLLLACHGPRFTVSIETQTTKANGDLGETFEVRVFDNDRGDEKPLHHMSGGQRVWINECLVRAIALYLAQGSGIRYGTLFSDEVDGPLDPERKLQLVKMKREVLRIGGYDREYFVSQTPELLSSADHVIDVCALGA